MTSTHEEIEAAVVELESPKEPQTVATPSGPIPSPIAENDFQ